MVGIVVVVGHCIGCVRGGGCCCGYYCCRGAAIVMEVADIGMERLSLSFRRSVIVMERLSLS